MKLRARSCDARPCAFPGEDPSPAPGTSGLRMISYPVEGSGPWAHWNISRKLLMPFHMITSPRNSDCSFVPAKSGTFAELRAEHTRLETAACSAGSTGSCTASLRMPDRKGFVLGKPIWVPPEAYDPVDPELAHRYLAPLARSVSAGHLARRISQTSIEILQAHTHCR